MKSIRLMSLCICIYGSLLNPAVALAEAPEIFQGLRHGATEAQTFAKFKGQISREVCSPALDLFSAASGHACDSLYISPYEVEGVPFKLSLYFTRDKRLLDQVGLFSISDLPAPEVGIAPDSRFLAKYVQLKAALTTRYGLPTSARVVNKEGYTMASADWRTKGGVSIGLSSNFSPSTSERAARGGHTIVYSTDLSGSAGKL